MAGLKPIMENILERAKNQMERKNNSVTEYMEISPALYSLLEQDGLKVLFLHICALTTTKKLQISFIRASYRNSCHQKLGP